MEKPIIIESNSVTFGDSVFTETNHFALPYRVENKLTPGYEVFLRAEGIIPKNAIVFIPSGQVLADWESPGWFSIHEYAFRIGIRFPFSDFVKDVITTLGVTPAQLSPQLWKLIRSIDYLSEKYKLPINASDLHYQYEVRGQTKFRVGVRTKDKSKNLIINTEETVSDWQNRFVFIKKDSMEGLAEFIPDKMVEEGKKTLILFYFRKL